MRPRVNLLYVPGTNCHRETAEIRRVGGEPRILLLADLLSGAQRLDDAEVVCLPGQLRLRRPHRHGQRRGRVPQAPTHRPARRGPREAADLQLHGFQVAGGRGSSKRSRFRRERARHIPRRARARPPPVVAEDIDSFWLEGLRGATIEFPCAHGEGRFIYEQRDGWCTALRYPPDANPDGSADDVAGITTPDDSRSVSCMNILRARGTARPRAVRERDPRRSRRARERRAPGRPSRAPVAELLLSRAPAPGRSPSARPARRAPASSAQRSGARLALVVRARRP